MSSYGEVGKRLEKVGEIKYTTFTMRVAAEHNLNLARQYETSEELRGVKISWRPSGAFYPTFPAAPYSPNSAGL
jgi:hypothetical protein